MNKLQRGPNHGFSRTKEYDAWCKIKRRCSNKKDAAYKNYGGRGIAVCDSWTKSFHVFLKDMGGAPSALHTIDRIDNNKGYDPGNCRWATRIEQNRNTRRSIFHEINGEKKTLMAWCEMYGLTWHVVYQRFHKLGWTVEEALELKPKKKWDKSKTINS